MISNSLEVLKIIKHLKSMTVPEDPSLLMIQPYKTVKTPVIHYLCLRTKLQETGDGSLQVYQFYSPMLLWLFTLASSLWYLDYQNLIIFKIPIRGMNTTITSILKNPGFLAEQPARERVLWEACQGEFWTSPRMEIPQLLWASVPVLTTTGFFSFFLPYI